MATPSSSPVGPIMAQVEKEIKDACRAGSATTITTTVAKAIIVCFENAGASLKLDNLHVMGGSFGALNGSKSRISSTTDETISMRLLEAAPEMISFAIQIIGLTVAHDLHTAKPEYMEATRAIVAMFTRIGAPQFSSSKLRGTTVNSKVGALRYFFAIGDCISDIEDASLDKDWAMQAGRVVANAVDLYQYTSIRQVIDRVTPLLYSALRRGTLEVLLEELVTADARLFIQIFQSQSVTLQDLFREREVKPSPSDKNQYRKMKGQIRSVVERLTEGMQEHGGVTGGNAVSKEVLNLFELERLRGKPAEAPTKAIGRRGQAISIYAALLDSDEEDDHDGGEEETDASSGKGGSEEAAEAKKGEDETGTATTFMGSHSRFESSSESSESTFSSATEDELVAEFRKCTALLMRLFRLIYRVTPADTYDGVKKDILKYSLADEADRQAKEGANIGASGGAGGGSRTAGADVVRELLKIETSITVSMNNIHKRLKRIILVMENIHVVHDEISTFIRYTRSILEREDNYLQLNQHIYTNAFLMNNFLERASVEAGGEDGLHTQLTKQCVGFCLQQEHNYPPILLVLTSFLQCDKKLEQDQAAKRTFNLTMAADSSRGVDGGFIFETHESEGKSDTNDRKSKKKGSGRGKRWSKKEKALRQEQDQGKGAEPKNCFKCREPACPRKGNKNFPKCQFDRFVFMFRNDSEWFCYKCHQVHEVTRKGCVPATGQMAELRYALTQAGEMADPKVIIDFTTIGAKNDHRKGPAQSANALTGRTDLQTPEQSELVRVITPILESLAESQRQMGVMVKEGRQESRDFMNMFAQRQGPQYAAIQQQPHNVAQQMQPWGQYYPQQPMGPSQQPYGHPQRMLMDGSAASAPPGLGQGGAASGQGGAPPGFSPIPAGPPQSQVQAPASNSDNSASQMAQGSETQTPAGQHQVPPTASFFRPSELNQTVQQSQDGSHNSSVHMMQQQTPAPSTPAASLAETETRWRKAMALSRRMEEDNVGNDGKSGRGAERSTTNRRGTGRRNRRGNRGGQKKVNDPKKCPDGMLPQPDHGTGGGSHQ
jgi:hypothetical protein